MAELRDRRTPALRPRTAQIKIQAGLCVFALLSIEGSYAAYSSDDAKNTAENEGTAIVAKGDRPSGEPSTDTIDPGRHETPDVDDPGPIKPGGELTTRQKRIFVLGIGAGENN